MSTILILHSDKIIAQGLELFIVNNTEHQVRTTNLYSKSLDSANFLQQLGETFVILAEGKLLDSDKCQQITKLDRAKLILCDLPANLDSLLLALNHNSSYISLEHNDPQSIILAITCVLMGSVFVCSQAKHQLNKQEEILTLLINDFEAKFSQQIEANQQRIDASFRTYSQDLINQYQTLTQNLEVIEAASVNLTQAKISNSVSHLVKHAAHKKAVSDWTTMGRLGVYLMGAMTMTFISGFFTRSYFDYRYSNSGLSNQDTALLEWVKSDRGKLARDLVQWNSRGLTRKGRTRICEQEAAELNITLKLEGQSVAEGWCVLWMTPPQKR